jgi:hypothetical protein
MARKKSSVRVISCPFVDRLALPSKEPLVSWTLKPHAKLTIRQLCVVRRQWFLLTTAYCLLPTAY